jgi:hypothetical protein
MSVAKDCMAEVALSQEKGRPDVPAGDRVSPELALLLEVEARCAALEKAVAGILELQDKVSALEK